MSLLNELYKMYIKILEKTEIISYDKRGLDIIQETKGVVSTFGKDSPNTVMMQVRSSDFRRLTFFRFKFDFAIKF